MAYVLAASVGSVIGVLLVDWLARKGGEKWLERFVSRQKVEQLKQKIENQAGITVLFATLVPPPFPFTAVIMTASALQYPKSKLLGIVFGGRIVRYTIEAILALYFGRKLIRYINSEVFAYFVYGLMAVAAVASVLSILKWRSRPVQQA
jgi:membrane protein YqaA with SNARE-associated domain